MSKHIARSREYRDFRAIVPFKNICVDKDPLKGWKINEVNATSKGAPLVFFPPVGGRADVFFKQLLSFSSDGDLPIPHRVLSVEYPVHWSIKDLIDSFKSFLDFLEIPKVHIFGASLGGFVAQKFAEAFPTRVSSLILCNSFVNTCIYEEASSISYFWLLPAVALRRILLSNLKYLLPEEPATQAQTTSQLTLSNNNGVSRVKEELEIFTLDALPDEDFADKTEINTSDIDKKVTIPNNNKPEIADVVKNSEKVMERNGSETFDENVKLLKGQDEEEEEEDFKEDIKASIEFLMDMVRSLSQKQLASRLTLSCMPCVVDVKRIQHIPTTIVATKDNQAMSESFCSHMSSKFPDAFNAVIPKGGHFTYLTRPKQLNTIIKYHLERQNS